MPIREQFKHIISIKKRFFTKNIILYYQEATAMEYEEYLKRMELGKSIEFYEDLFLKNKVSKKDFQYILLNLFGEFEKDFLKNYLGITGEKTNGKPIEKDKIELSFAEMFGFLAGKGFDIFELASKYTFKQIKFMYKVAFYSDELTKYNELDKKTKDNNFSFLNSLQDFVLSKETEEQKEETNLQKNWKMQF